MYNQKRLGTTRQPPILRAFTFRDTTQAKNQRLRGVGGPPNGRFAIATYHLEQRFLVPPDADRWYVMGGELWYKRRDDRENQPWRALGRPFSGFNPDDTSVFNWPDAVRCTDEDEDGHYAEYEKRERYEEHRRARSR